MIVEDMADVTTWMGLSRMRQTTNPISKRASDTMPHP
jgi:hypothetical protein